jgi:hypothetical protein
MRAALTPVFELGGELVELVIGMQRGVNLHDGLHVIGFLK